MQNSNKKRTEKKSPKYYLSKKDIDSIGGLIFKDEIFKRCLHEPTLWISNYGRLISTQCPNPHLLHPSFKRGYSTVALHHTKRGLMQVHAYYVHIMVAELYCPVGEWIHDGDILQVHHIQPVNRKKHIASKDYATNLMWVPKKLHAMIERVKKIEIYNNHRWEQVDFLGASEFLQISPYEFFDICGTKRKKPAWIDSDKWEYYYTTADQNCDQNKIEFRIKRK